MDIFIGELLGMTLFIFLATATSAAVTLKKSSANDSGWVFIAFGWGLALMAGLIVAIPLSGGHLNPAVSLAFLLEGSINFVEFLTYVVAQLLGAIIGASLTYVLYYDHFKAQEDWSGVLSIFATGPAIRNIGRNMFSEALGAFILVIFVLATTLYAPGLAPIFVPLLLVGIAMAMGNVTSFGINPARDLGPRLVHQFLIKDERKTSSDWGYVISPLVGPFIGAVVAVIIFVGFMA